MVGIKQFVFRWAATTVAVMVASSVIHGIRYDTVAALIGASLLLGILNAFVRPILLILSAPVILPYARFFHSRPERILAASSAQRGCRISCRQLLEPILGRDCGQHC
jgi:Mycobacterial 4 TMS phage holin, superfamily IV